MSTSFSEFKPLTAESQFLLLPLFYSFPKELVTGSEFFDLPRNMYEVLSDKEAIERIKSKQFLKDMIDMTAYMVWFHLGHRGWMEVYSGYSPAFVFSHQLRYWRDLFYTVYRDMNLFDLIRRQVYLRWPRGHHSGIHAGRICGILFCGIVHENPARPEGKCSEM